MSETELAEKLIPWLQMQKFDIYPEYVLRYGGIIDILAVRGIVTWAIEVKKSLTLTVLNQASDRPTLYRSIFIPRSLSGRAMSTYVMAKDYFKVGVILYDRKNEMIHQQQKAPLIREHYNYSKYIMSNLTEEHKTYARPGMQFGERLTPYRQTMNSVKTFIKRNPGCTIKEIHEHIGKGHYSSDQSFKQSVKYALERFEDWATLEDGKYYHKD